MNTIYRLPKHLLSCYNNIHKDGHNLICVHVYHRLYKVIILNMKHIFMPAKNFIGEQLVRWESLEAFCTIHDDVMK